MRALVEPGSCCGAGPAEVPLSSRATHHIPSGPHRLPEPRAALGRAGHSVGTIVAYPATGRVSWGTNGRRAPSMPAPGYRGRVLSLVPTAGGHRMAAAPGRTGRGRTRWGRTGPGRAAGPDVAGPHQTRSPDPAASAARPADVIGYETGMIRYAAGINAVRPGTNRAVQGEVGPSSPNSSTVRRTATVSDRFQPRASPSRVILSNSASEIDRRSR